MTVALLALFVALGGTAAAAKTLITSSKQIKAGSVQRSDIAKSAVNSSRIADGGIASKDLDAATQSSLAQAGTQSMEVIRKTGPDNVEASAQAVVATMKDIPPGAYAIFAKTNLSGDPEGGGVLAQPPVSGSCALDVGGDADKSYTFIGAPGAPIASLTTQITHTFDSPGTAKLTCGVTNAKWSAGGTSIIALRVSAPTRLPVDGR